MKPIQPDEAISLDELVRLTPKDADQPVLPLESEKRGADLKVPFSQKPF